MAYRTTGYIIDTVYSLLSGLSVKKYKVTKPTKASDSEYIVINCLPIPANVMQVCIFNVNYHVKDKGDGIPDHEKISAGETAVLAVLEKVTASNYLIDFESQETFREEGEHFSNLRFSFKYINS